MAEEVVSVGGFAVPMRFVSVAVPMSDGVELKPLCPQGTSLAKLVNRADLQLGSDAWRLCVF